MNRLFKKPFRFAMIYSTVLTVFLVYALLDAFVIPKSAAALTSVSNSEAEASSKTEASDTEAVITETSYQDENINITIETITAYETAVYIADIQISNISYLQAALAQNTYGRNIKETTSAMAEENNALFAINGDYYGFRSSGFVLRDGVLYRDTSNGVDALVINSEGNFSIIDEDEISAASLYESGAWQVFSFGPALIENGTVLVDETSEVSQSKSSNPRTAIAQISELHYLVIVSDGRTRESEGLTLLELATLFAERGAEVAYNLDGGGSSTMVFNGEVINQPTSGNSSGEREVSDIVYIGY